MQTPNEQKIEEVSAVSRSRGGRIVQNEIRESNTSNADRQPTVKEERKQARRAAILRSTESPCCGVLADVFVIVFVSMLTQALPLL